MAGKRKRDRDLSLPPPSAQAINPHSYPPAKLAQFAVAGLSDTDEDPAKEIKDFPHRGFKYQPSEPALESDYDIGPEDEGDDEPAPETKPKRVPDAHQRHLAVLTKSIHQLLGQGHVAKAARAFGLALQLRPSSRPLDLRHDNLWALGAEIIMREGEEYLEEARRNKDSQDKQEYGGTLGTGDGFQVPPPRWGSAANMNKLRAYLETLIRQHPYDHRAPKKISALQFNISLYSSEVYNIYAEYAAGLAGAGTQTEDEPPVDESPVHDYVNMSLETLDEDRSFHFTEPRRLKELSLTPQDKIRTQTLGAIKTVAARMDALMRELPYSKNHEMLRLRAAASLFMADLVVPAAGGAAAEDPQVVDDQRRRDIEAARQVLRTVLGSGGILDDASRALVEADEAEESLRLEAQIYSATPTRET
ncbi:hypothetical protein ISF_03425 [Cordyceps fumosorosea ARSEF 2679]|uniref:Uncharacterized protein n=1 Tax=Cordyceps fumosorosea (strain ARSEF 2679) TaxID=1081104 RepID=A0A168AQE0_CORFA|nr:hypothetical protein ISF_03425 [Cordyceps fumosorosea ARSEF 2679]OAA69050.1 hypothetical protein ISF_03425 [Cordyceps fumosorosea ARSEF 2679]